ncbi:MAG: arylamine N-acetyltransferase [Campylobacteraceae bacterium]|nr:arylamine N-acetyltransferase [Campylobacteraceae bacterium]
MKNREILKNYLNALKIDHEIKTLEDIEKLIRAHLRTLSFSNSRILLKEEMSLDLNSIYENIVIKKRGGYCFEHNKLMYEVLKGLGFNVTHYLARVLNNRDAIPPKTHRFTLLDFDKKRYLVDVGVGHRSPSVPVLFGDKPSMTHLGAEYKIVELEDKTFAMQLTEENGPFMIIKFDLNRCYESDFEMGHFYAHKNPNAVFVNNFVSSIIQDSAIYSLVNNRYFIFYKSSKEEIEIQSSKQLEQIMKNDLNLGFTFEEISFLYENYINKKLN